MKITGIILAGGKNLRMGKNKAFLEINGERIIDRTKNLFVDLFDEVLLVTNSPLEYFDLNLRTVSDLLPGGALGGDLHRPFPCLPFPRFCSRLRHAFAQSSPDQSFGNPGSRL